MEDQTQSNFWYALSLAFQLGFLIVAPLVGFVLLGVWLDNLFSLTPFFLLTGIFLSLAVTIDEIYHLLLPLIKNHND